MAKEKKSSRIAINRIQGVPETMLIPLWARAEETKRPNGVVRDDFAVRMVSQIDYDFSKFESAKLSQTGCAIRTMLFDNATRAFVRKNPGCVVVNLGCGLDTRYARLRDEPIAIWYDLDLPEAIELRRRFFEESEGNRFIAESAFDTAWMEEIQSGGRPLLFVAEGLLMYFPEERNRGLFDALIAKFPGAEMLIETLGPMLVGRSKRHDCVNMVDKAPEFLWGERNTRDMERWNPNLNYIEEWHYFDYYKKRWGKLRWFLLIPGFRNRLGNRITHFRFSPNDRRHA